ncbi:hypothetical protein [Pararhizobium gei]|uniref:hypothetical protein n=1 Tax=Pararhizobium gei TaxID=1395951 RepID=UPI0023DBDA87|nr:hypothetical protein [Rhizobium gei]
MRSFDKAGSIELKENGWKIAREFGHLDYGCCSTSMSSQGRTVHTVLVAMGRESVPAMSSEQFYFTVSRGRHAMRLYTDDIDAVQDAITKSGARGSATELLEKSVDRKAAPLPQHDRLEAHTESVMRMTAIQAREKVASGSAAPAQRVQALTVSAVQHQGVVREHEAIISR